ncbi:MAG: endonuclease NucS [Chitinophagaceae bacterium]
MNNIEDSYRDKLAENLGLLDPGLTLLGKEYYVPKGKLTKSFIDILARDADNNYVIIEVKRSNQSAREAIHEIYKYTQAIKETYHVTDGEIKSIIVSTEWAELFIPFSAFHNETNITINGYRMVVDGHHNITSIHKIIPCKTNKGRVFSPVHDCNLYRTPADLYKGLQSCVNTYPIKQIKDYVLVILLAKEFTESIYQEEVSKIITAVTNNKPYKPAITFGNERRINFIIYTAFQRLNDEVYWQLIEKDPEGYEYIKDEIESMQTKDEDTISELLEDKVLYNLEPFPFCNDTEIGYPAKFSHKILELEKWQVIQILRSPSFANNTLLTDEKITAEISGHTGSSHTQFYGSCDSSHKARFTELKDNIAKALKYNVTWKRHTSEFLSSLDSTQHWEIGAHIYSPSHPFLTLFKIVIDDINKWMPLYSLSAKSTSQHFVFLGTFAWNKQIPVFKELLKKYYEDDPFNIILPLNWGGFEENCDEILEDLGLSYVSFKVERLADKDMYYQYDNYKFVPVDKIHNELDDFLVESEEFMFGIIDAYKQHYVGLVSE